MLTACQTCPDVNQIKYLTADPTPNIVAFDPHNPELPKILTMQSEFFTAHLKLLLDAQSTELFTDDIQDEIDYCNSVLDWLNNLSE